MTMYGKHPPLSLAGDPSDPDWYWFIYNGPHGARFVWQKERYVDRDIDYLKKFIEQREEANPRFKDRIRAIALESLEVEDVVMIRTAIQILCVVGDGADFAAVSDFVNHEEEAVRKDAMSCLFEHGLRIKRA